MSEATAVLPTSIWSDIKTTLRAIFSATVTSAEAVNELALTTKESITIARNEVQNIDEMQQIRLDQTKAERKAQQAQFAASIKAIKAA